MQSVTSSYHLRIATASFQHTGRAHRCRFLAYSYTTLLVPTYVVVLVLDNGTYGPQRVSKDIIFDESCVYDKYIDNSSSDAEFAALALPIEHLSLLYKTYQYHLKTCLSSMHHHLSSILPLLYAYMSLRYIVTWLLISLTLNLSPDPSEYVEQINQYGHVQYWNSVTGECSNVPVKTITSMHFGIFMSLFLMSSAIASLAPKSFVKAILNPLWHPPILKELDNFFENTCFEWTPDIGQRHLWMIWLFSYKANYDLKARMVIDGSKCILGVDFNPDEVYCGTVTATSIKIFFAPSALYGLILR